MPPIPCDTTPTRRTRPHAGPDRAPLHVAIGVIAGVTGGPAAYGRRLVHALAALPDRPRITVLTDRPDAFAGTPDLADVIRIPLHGGLDRLRWQHVALPRALRRLRPDVYHDTKNALPRALVVPAVVTVHDLAYHVLPETFGAWSRAFLRRATADAVRRAAAVVVPSTTTANDLARIHPEAAGKTLVVPHGIDPAPALEPDEAAAIRARLRLPERYVLHVGTIQARKNVDLLVRAVRTLRARGLPHRAVLVGRKGWLSGAALAEIRADDTARWLGHLSARDLAAVYAGADAFVSPSAYEGFGLAVGDALAAGVPTVVSNAGSLPEVCGDAAVVLPELTAPAIADALAALLADPGCRARLAAAGRARAASFSWHAAAEGHLRAYARAHAARATPRS